MAKTPRILIVDDFVDIAQLLGRLITAIGGYETRTATDGLDAIRIAEEFRPDVVLLDLGMPNVNGFETAKRMRKRWSKRVVLIAVSGQRDERYQQLAKEVGFDGYLLKPVGVTATVQLIQAHLHAHCPATRKSSLTRQRFPAVSETVR
jgi:DNA-binding response OmpR family regulator